MFEYIIGGLVVLYLIVAIGILVEIVKDKRCSGWLAFWMLIVAITWPVTIPIVFIHHIFTRG